MITKLLNEINEKIEKLNKILGDNNYFSDLENRIDKINNMNIELRKRIDKAIEYIKSKENKSPQYYTFKSDILEILKGSDKE